MANDPAFDYYGNAPGFWGRLRARWANMSSAYRYNAVLYGLAAIALTALVLEVSLGESSPKFEVATQVVPITTTTRPRPTSTSSTTIDPLATTTTAVPVAGEPAGGRAPIGPLTPATRRRPAGGGQGSPNPAPGGGSDTQGPGEPPPEDEIPNSTFPPLDPPSNPGTTNPPSTNPPPTNPQPTTPPPTFKVPPTFCEYDPSLPGCP